MGRKHIISTCSALGHSLVDLLICLHGSPICLLRIACFTRSLRWPHLFARLLNSIQCSWVHGKEVYVLRIDLSKSRSFNPLWNGIWKLRHSHSVKSKRILTKNPHSKRKWATKRNSFGITEAIQTQTIPFLSHTNAKDVISISYKRKSSHFYPIQTQKMSFLSHTNAKNPISIPYKGCRFP